MAKGYDQTYGVDYSNTISPVAKMTFVRIFISLAASYRISTRLTLRMSFFMVTFRRRCIWSNLSKVCCIRGIGKVCHLRKSLYSLKQSPRAWFDKFNQAVKKFGMHKSKSNNSIFYKNSSSCIILLVVYVNDIVITGNDSKVISSLKSFLYGQFHTKDLGMLRYFLGVEVMRRKHGIFLSQRKYVLDL